MKKLLAILGLFAAIHCSAIPYVVNLNGNATNLNAPQVSTANIYVRTNGVDATAARNTQNAFNTLSNAFLAAQTGDIIDIGPGNFGVTNTLIMPTNATLRGAGPWVTWLQIDLAITNVMHSINQLDWIRVFSGDTFLGFAISKSPTYYGNTMVPGYPFGNRTGTPPSNTKVIWQDVDWIGENDTLKVLSIGTEFDFNRCNIRNYDDGFLLANSASNHVVFRNSTLISTIETNSFAQYFNPSPAISVMQVQGTVDLINSYIAQINIEKANPPAGGVACVFGDYINCYNSTFLSTIPANVANANDSSSGLYMQCFGNYANDYINIYDGYVPSNRVDAVQLGDGSGSVNYYGMASSNYWNQLDYLTTVPGFSTNVNTGATHLFFTNGILVKVTIP